MSRQKGEKMKKRLQLNIRLTPEQDILINKKIQQTKKTKTQIIIDALNENPIYIVPNFNEVLKEIKYLGNKTNELNQKLNEKNLNTQETQTLIQQLQQGCNELWRLLKLLNQEKPKQV